MRLGTFLLALVLVVALGACNLSSDDEETIPSATPPSASPPPPGRPMVMIISPQTGSEVVVNEPILMSVNATDTVGVTLVQLLVGGQIVRSFSSEVPGGETSKNLLIDYTPRSEGNLTLRVVAFRETVSSEPAEITLIVRRSQAQITATSQPDSNIPTIDPNDPTCRALINTSLNFRTGPGTNYGIIAVLSYGEVIPIIGRLGDNSWLKLRRNWTEGWVSADYVRTYGNCLSVPVVQPPAAPTSTAPTPTPTPTSTTAISTATTVPPTATFTQEPLPNLAVSNIDGPRTVTIPSGATSITETYSVVITNRGGNLNRQFSTIVMILPGDIEVDVGVVGNLGPNQSVSLDADITFSAAGTYILQFAADSGNQIEESNEVDNSGTINVTVNQE